MESGGRHRTGLSLIQETSRSKQRQAEASKGKEEQVLLFVWNKQKAKTQDENRQKSNDTALLGIWAVCGILLELCLRGKPCEHLRGR